MSEWRLETDKARLSEVVRIARERGPQTITVRGADAAVLLSADDYKRLTARPGQASWVDAFRKAFTDDVDLMRDPDTVGTSSFEGLAARHKRLVRACSTKA